MITDSKESEMMVLGCMLNNHNDYSMGSSRLSFDDFNYPEHVLIFKALKKLFDSKSPADISIVSEQLKSSEELDKAGGIGYLVGLAQYVGTAAHFEVYVDQLLERSSRRKIWELIVNSPQKNLFELKEIINAKLDKSIAKQCSVDALYRPLLCPTSEQDIIDEIHVTSPGIRVGLTIGDIDFELPGGAICIAAGPTSHGKTTLLINLALGALKENPNKSIYFFSYEESKAAIVTSFLNTYLEREVSRNNRRSIESYFRDGSCQHIQEEERVRFLKEKDAFFKMLIGPGRLNIFYSELAAEQLCQAIKYLHVHRKDIAAVFIDYMQLLNLIDTGRLNRQEQLKRICLMLKDCAVETGFPIVIGAQFNRQVTCEADLSPTYISEAGDIERIASVVLGFWNRSFLGFSKEGNKTKKGDVIEQPRPEIYIEVLKGRKIGNGHHEVLSFHGNMGTIKNIQSQESRFEEVLF